MKYNKVERLSLSATFRILRRVASQRRRRLQHLSVLIILIHLPDSVHYHNKSSAVAAVVKRVAKVCASFVSAQREDGVFVLATSSKNNSRRRPNTHCHQWHCDLLILLSPFFSARLMFNWSSSYRAKNRPRRREIVSGNKELLNRRSLPFVRSLLKVKARLFFRSPKKITYKNSPNKNGLLRVIKIKEGYLTLKPGFNYTFIIIRLCTKVAAS